MVDSRRHLQELEIFWPKLSLVDLWKALVLHILIISLRLMILYYLAGAGKSVLSYVPLHEFPSEKVTMFYYQFFNHSGYSRDVRNWTSFTSFLLL
jgi:hypothetical protein